MGDRVKTVRLRMRKKRGPTREIAHRQHMENARVPIRYAMKSYRNKLKKKGEHKQAAYITMICQEFGWRKATSEYACEIFIKHGKYLSELELRHICDSEKFAHWLDRKTRKKTIEPVRKRIKVKPRAWKEAGDKWRAEQREWDIILHDAKEKRIERTSLKQKLEAVLNKLKVGK